MTTGTTPCSTTAANNALAASTAVPEGVEATAKNGNLTLTGAVKYPSQCAAAESAVGGLTGVRNINNEIGFVFDVDPADVNPLVRQALDSHKVWFAPASLEAAMSANCL